MAYEVTILAGDGAAIEDAFQNGDISGLETTTLKQNFGMEFLPYPESYFELDEGAVYRILTYVHKAGSDKVTVYVSNPGGR